MESDNIRIKDIIEEPESCASKERQIIAIQDLSCMGRCSATVSLPIISVAGIKVNIIPTAILSTQTDGFTDYTFKDLTEDMLPIAKHWSSLNLQYDAIYTSFLGSLEQMEVVQQIISKLASEKTLRFVDPVLGDGGELYSCYNEKFVENMRKLCALADVITPNVTEAALLTGKEYREGILDKEYLLELLEELSTLGVKRFIVITGACFSEERTGVAVYDCLKRKASFFMTPAVIGRFPGAGDVYASSLLASILNNINMEKSAEIALKFTSRCINSSVLAGTEPRYGLDFEKNLKYLAEDIFNSL